jgi:glycosyltransferase involved in cell wall biosynthesis
MFWVKWVLIILIYVFFFVFDTLFAFGSYIFPCLLGSIGSFFIVFFFSRKRFLRQMIVENSELVDYDIPGSVKIAVVFVVKNEGEAFLRNLEEYLSLPDNVKIYVFDDGSTDGTYEKIIHVKSAHESKIGKPKEGRIVLSRVPSSFKKMHPKGIALEEAFHKVDCDIFFVGDADTRISPQTFNKSLVYMIREQLELLHLTRRNTEMDTLSYSIADCDEVFASGLHTLNMIPFNFTGSSFFITKKVAMKIEFPNRVYSEDSEIGKQAIALTKKRGFSISFHTLERAPHTVFLLLKQRWNWNKYALCQYFEKDFPTVLLAVILSANIIFGLFNIYSFNFIFTLFGMFMAMSFSLSTNLYIASKKLSEAFISSFAYVLLILLQFGFLYFIQILCLPRNQKHGIYYNKTKLQNE